MSEHEANSEIAAGTKRGGTDHKGTKAQRRKKHTSNIKGGSLAEREERSMEKRVRHGAVAEASQRLPPPRF